MGKSPRMWKTRKVCPTCSHRLLLTRLQKRYFCPNCREYVDESLLKAKAETVTVLSKL